MAAPAKAVLGLKRLPGYNGPPRGPFENGTPNKRTSKKMRRAQAELDTRTKVWQDDVKTSTKITATLRKPGRMQMG